MLSAVSRFSGVVPPNSRMVVRRGKGGRAIDATTFRGEDLFARNPRVELAGPECDGSTLGWIRESLQDWQFDVAGHQREMSLCEIMKYATVNPVMAIAPRTRRFSTGNGSPMTSSNGVK